jgi:hypothetical protein
VATPRAAVRATPPVIGTHLIDRYDAIDKERAAVSTNPQSLDDWIILGELAHEVAMDGPPGEAAKYFRMSRDAFEKALALDPDNNGLKAAVQFAKDREAQGESFERSRDTVTDAFLAARRRDLAATGHMPSIRVASTIPPLPSRELPGPTPAPATPQAAANQAAAAAKADLAVNPAVQPGVAPVSENTPAITPARGNTPATDTANLGTQQNYSAPGATAPTLYVGPVQYQPFAVPNGPAYTYQQYSSAYFPPGLYTNPSLPPVTVQRYTLTAPSPVPNAFERRILNRAGVPTPP